MWFRWAACVLLLWAGALHAKQSVVFVVAASPKVVVTNPQGQRYTALPTQRLLQGHRVDVPKGQRFAVVVLATGERRVYKGPARLSVIADTVRVLSGPPVKVSSLAPFELDLIEQWKRVYARPRGAPQAEKPALHTVEDPQLQVVEPLHDSLLLTRSPEFVFRGDLPREGNLMLFDSQGKRFWVEPLESLYVTLPAAARFEWGQSFTWEVRRLTGGRVVSGSFRIASEETARALLEARVPDTPKTLPETKLFYGMRLHLAGAYLEARAVWASLGLSMSPTGQPSRLQ